MSDNAVLEILQRAVERYNELDLKQDVALGEALSSRDLREVDRILEERATLLINLPLELAEPLKDADLEIKRRLLGDLAYLAGVAKEAINSGNRSKLSILPMYLISIRSKIGDKNELEKMRDYVQERVSS